MLQETVQNVPVDYELYCTEDTVAYLTEILVEIQQADLDAESDEKLAEMLFQLESAINNLVYKPSDVPVVYISTDQRIGNQLTLDYGYAGAAISIVDTDGSCVSEDRGQIKVRGNSTSGGVKKPYNIKFSAKENILGMGKAKKWTLLANCYDPSLLRNYIALNLAAQMELAYTSECKFCDVWLDGQFMGNYLLTESVEAGKTRVDIEVDKEDFLLELDARVALGAQYVVSKNGVRFEIKEPEEPSQEQLEKIQKFIDECDEAIRGNDYSKVIELIDVDSIAKMYLLNEYLKTVDCAHSSVFYYVKNGKLYGGPAWDFDLSMGNASKFYPNYYDKDGQTFRGLWAKQNCWFDYLLSYSEFDGKVKDFFVLYKDIFQGIYETMGMIDQALNTCEASFKRNYSEAGWNIKKVYSGLEHTPFPTYEQNVEYLRGWLRNRYVYLCEIWDFGHGQHQWNETYTIDKAATCTEEGQKSIHCFIKTFPNRRTIGQAPKSGI